MGCSPKGSFSAPGPSTQSWGLILFTAFKKSSSVTVCRLARIANMPASVQMLRAERCEGSVSGNRLLLHLLGRTHPLLPLWMHH